MTAGHGLPPVPLSHCREALATLGPRLGRPQPTVGGSELLWDSCLNIQANRARSLSSPCSTRSEAR